MKLNKLFVGLLGALALTACSSEENIPQTPDTPSDNSEARFMSVTIRNTGVNGTRAGGDQNGNYEEGLSGENAVSSLRFYFFKGDGSEFPIASNNLNYYECKSNEIEVYQPKDENGNDIATMPNVEKIYKSVIVLQGQGVDFTQLKSMVAVVNYNKSELGNASKTLMQLQSIVEDYSISEFYNNSNESQAKIPNMLMTSSVYSTSADYEGCETFISPSKLKTNKDDAIGDPVDVYVERVLAKVRVTAEWDSQTEKDQTGVLIKLKDKDGNYLKSADNKQLYVKFEGWGMQTLINKSHLFKNIGEEANSAAWTTNLGDWWNDAPKHRSYWAVNPTRNDIAFLHAKHTDAKGKIATKYKTVENGVTTTKEYDGDFAYVQENAGDEVSSGLKNYDYDPSRNTSQRTQVYLRATLVDEDGNAVSLAKFGSVYYTEDKVLEAMLSTVSHQIKVKATNTDTASDGTVTTTTDWKDIPKEFIKLANAEDVDKADNKTENSKRYLSYITLKDNYEELLNNYDGKFYDANHTEISADDVKKILTGMPGAKVWKNGMTYYYIDLQHLNPGTGNETKGMYGVVRNHIYEVIINSVTGLGTPVLIPDDEQEKEIIPQKPGDDEYFLGARLNILSWRVVANKTGLVW